MFTGIVETLAEVVKIEHEGSNVHLFVRSSLTPELKIDQSVCHNGVCLTVVAIVGDVYKVTAIEETLKRSNIGALKVGGKVNLERCMPANGRFDGHIVQGHVDLMGECAHIEDKNGSWLFTFLYQNTEHLVVEKGSITINGTSLTCFNCVEDRFSVAIIPYTFEHTNFQELKVGDRVNLEFDIVGKYIQKILSRNT
jgi:riboflavin synthase